MDPELEKRREETDALMFKLAPMFNGVHSFTVMMVLADLAAQWLRSHPPQETPRLGTVLIATIGDRLEQLNRQDDEETLH